MSYAAKPVPPALSEDRSNPLGVVSLVLSLIGVFAGCPIAIAGVVTGWIAMKREPNGMAKAGFAVGLVAMVLHTLVLGLLLLMMLGFAVAIPTQTQVAPGPTVEAIQLPSGASMEMPPASTTASPMPADVEYFEPGPDNLVEPTTESPAETEAPESTATETEAP